MRRLRGPNVNTSHYWDRVYRSELRTGRRRVDDERYGQLARWIGIRNEELGCPASVLDAGCGHGEVLERLKSDFPLSHLRGVDLSPHAVQMGNRRLRSPKKTVGSLELFEGNVAAIPFAARQFDIVWCGETLEHADDPGQVIGELIRIVRNGGLIVLSVPYRQRNYSVEHLWEFEPDDICRWARRAGELVFLDCRMLPGWISMFAVLRRDSRRNLWKWWSAQ